MAAVTVPRLVIHGARDNTPLAGNREWVAGQANVRLLVIEGAGHWRTRAAAWRAPSRGARRSRTARVMWT